jgi:hypothetical protein
MRRENEDRQNFRAAVVERCEGSLYIDHLPIPVCVVDQSAGGFKLSTESQQAVTEMSEGILDLNDGVQHIVQVRRVTHNDGQQTIGVKVEETRVSQPIVAPSTARRKSLVKSIAAGLCLFLVVLAAQAEPVRKQLADVSWFGSAAPPKPVKNPTAAPPVASSKQRPAPQFDRSRPFEFQQVVVDEDSADWLELDTVQRRVMRGLVNLCGGARKNRSAPAQAALVDFAANASLLESLNADQRSRYEQELGRPLTGSALLRDVVERYSAQVSAQELSTQFGVLLFVVPTIAGKYGVPSDVAAEVSKQIDEAIGTADKNGSSENDGQDAEQRVLELTGRLKELETRCRKLLVSAAAKP